ncbi:hypothetical protein [Streptomyces sp. enrichment culture]|uniref:hypothetical protein n=1 Tax=Streptomyces sp. enrichment culture TaxID=1795815 RepID=UPI003F563C4D
MTSRRVEWVAAEAEAPSVVTVEDAVITAHDALAHATLRRGTLRRRAGARTGGG